MTGGCISGNFASGIGRGIYIHYYGSFTISGNATVSDDIALNIVSNSYSAIKIGSSSAWTIEDKAKLELDASARSNTQEAIDSWISKPILQSAGSHKLIEDDLKKFTLGYFIHRSDPGNRAHITGYRLVCSLDGDNATLEKR